jgi:hypothetical protein
LHTILFNFLKPGKKALEALLDGLLAAAAHAAEISRCLGDGGGNDGFRIVI